MLLGATPQGHERSMEFINPFFAGFTQKSYCPEGLSIIFINQGFIQLPMDIAKKYGELAKKYDLPSFEQLDVDFEIGDIENDHFLLREVRRHMMEKIEDLVKILEPILQPDVIICDMHECKIFDDESKKELYDLYRTLMFFHRYSIEISINEIDETSSKFISKFYKEWEKIKPVFSKIVIKLKDSWLQDGDAEEHQRYVG